MISFLELAAVDIQNTCCIISNKKACSCYNRMLRDWHSSFQSHLFTQMCESVYIFPVQVCPFRAIRIETSSSTRLTRTRRQQQCLHHFAQICGCSCSCCNVLNLDCEQSASSCIRECTGAGGGAQGSVQILFGNLHSKGERERKGWGGSANYNSKHTEPLTQGLVVSFI